MGICRLDESARFGRDGRPVNGVADVAVAPPGCEPLGCGLTVNGVGSRRPRCLIEVVLGHGRYLVFADYVEGNGLGRVVYGIAIGAQFDGIFPGYGRGAEERYGVAGFVVCRRYAGRKLAVEFHAVATVPPECEGVDGHIDAYCLFAFATAYFRESGILYFTVADVIAQVGWLVISHILPGDAHAVHMVVHKGGYAVLGGRGCGKYHQRGRIVPAPQNNFFPPVSQQIGLETWGRFGAVA